MQIIKIISTKQYKKKSIYHTLLINIYLFIWPRHTACGILLIVPLPGIEPTPPAVEAQSLNHWTAREVPVNISL